MPLKPIPLGDKFGVAIFDNGNQIGMSQYFSGTYYKSEKNAQRAIDRLTNKFGVR
jgi:hypothetical protein